MQEVPDGIQLVLDLAFEQLQEVDARNLKKKNKFTEWRNNYEFGWCGGFVTWCMLEAGIPQEEKNKIREGEVEGLVHVKEAGVGKLYTGYGKMNRLTRVPQKGFVAVYGNQGSGGSTPYYHVGLVYDVENLGDGRYRLTTIEGDVPTPGDTDHPKNGHTVRMFIRDYDMNLAADKKLKKKDMTYVPEEEWDRYTRDSRIDLKGHIIGSPIEANIWICVKSLRQLILLRSLPYSQKLKMTCGSNLMMSKTEC